MQQEITYVWTNQDQLIWRGDSAGSAQGPFVSPYGIRADQVPSPPAAGAPIQLDLAWSIGGQCGRANRFHVTGPWIPKDLKKSADWSTEAPEQAGDRDPVHGYHTFEWIEWAMPPGVSTLGQLCDHLVATDDKQFPKQLYGSRAPRQWDTNAAMMLFDYWGNSKFRQATCDGGGFSWEANYLQNADGIALTAPNGERLTWVLRRKTILPKVPVAPAKSKGNAGGPLVTRTRSQAELDMEMDSYVTALEGSVATIRWLFEVSDNVMKRRCQLVRSAAAIRAAAFVSTLSLKQGNDDAVEIASLLDEVLPTARDWLMQQPVAQTDRAPSEPLPGTGLVLGGTIAHQTQNARADMDSEIYKLDRLLFGDVWLDTVKAWTTNVVDILQNHNSALDWDAIEKGSVMPGFPHLESTGATFARFTRLQKAIAAAVECYGEGAYPSGGTTRIVRMTSDDLLKLFDNARDSHAKGPADISGASPLAVSLSLVGKFYSFAKETSKLGVALLRVCVTWDVLKFAKTTLKSGGAAAASAFADLIINRLPDLDMSDVPAADQVKLRTEAGDALRKGERSATRKLADKVAKKAVAEPAAWKSLCAVLDILNLILALSKASSPSEGLVAHVEWLTVGVEVVDVFLGSAEALTKHLGNLESVVAKLERLGSAVKVMGALLAFAQGGIGLIDALTSGRKNAAEITRAALMFTGGAAGLFTAASVYFGLATGGVGFAIEAFGIACVLAATAMDLGRMIARDTPFVETMSKLVLDLRQEPEWSALERAESTLREKMQRVEVCSKGERGLYPGANTMNHWRHLRANGLSDDAIRKLLSVGAATGPLDADATWQG